MALKELFTTRRTRESTFGTTMERTFQMTYAEFDQVFDIFVGNGLDESVIFDGPGSGITANDRNLRVTEITQNGIDNENTNVTVFYSTVNSPATEAVPDAASSWVEVFDISPVDEAATTYTDQGNGDILDWQADWAANKPEGGAEIAPELIIRKNNLVFNITMYATTLYFNRIANSIGRINGINFLNNYFGFPPQSNIPNDVNINDFDQWLFSACPISRIAKNTWRYDFAFEYSGNHVGRGFTFGWNEVEGLEVVRYSNKNPFNGQLFNFMDLFEGMNLLINTDVSVRTGR